MATVKADRVGIETPRPEVRVRFVELRHVYPVAPGKGFDCHFDPIYETDPDKINEINSLTAILPQLTYEDLWYLQQEREKQGWKVAP
ncbi:MAG: hypothetical protein KKF56_00350 [Nanoarchaeota archaeon]|nr:hypothetical protein [Nanoarchaeota archaeon]